MRCSFSLARHQLYPKALFRADHSLVERVEHFSLGSQHLVFIFFCFPNLCWEKQGFRESRPGWVMLSLTCSVDGSSYVSKSGWCCLVVSISPY